MDYTAEYQHMTRHEFGDWAALWSNRGKAVYMDRVLTFKDSPKEALAHAAMFEVRTLGRRFGPQVPR